MIDFAEEFLKPEIREGFFVDATMKSVWAAELEVLQKIAVVCEEYGLAWYAAYGTLLGAIRHEGYIPWDDDMDIWMKREDYSKLMQVLPGRLPEGYHVLSCLTEEGYDQFHSCVVAGEGISIEPEWLKMHHGCPFTIGVDIFPLDYLPRNEKRQEQLKTRYEMIRRIDQLVKECCARECGAIPIFPQSEEEMLEEIRSGLGFLEKHENFRMEGDLLRQRRWKEMASALYRFANQMVMLTREEDADELVEFRNYVHYDRQRFSKDWFRETWSAEFENVMLPIPWKYDEVLQAIYGNYKVCVRNVGGHDYPYYEAQLEELRERMRQWQRENGEIVKEPIFPENWKDLPEKAGGSRRKIVLYTNDVTSFIEGRERALDKLEEVLALFYRERERLVLWWRPKESMVQALSLVSDELVQRYLKILQAYKREQWGICDETNDSVRAIKACDAYYGGQDNMIRKICALHKPVMIANEQGNV